jgi:hypothetical protein
MAPGTITPGRRLQVDTDPNGRHHFEMPEKPGDYVGPVRGYTGDKLAVFFLKPNARDEGVSRHARSVQHVCSPPHVFTEQPDGSLEIRESISNLAGGKDDDGWHGYLDAGHPWRQQV